MEELLDQYVIAFPLFFAALWLLITGVISWGGGWNRLAEYYRAYDPSSGYIKNFQSIQLNRIFPANYNTATTFGADFSALHLSVFFIFRFMHPPLKIPYSDLTGTEETGFISSSVLLKVAQAPGISIKISKKLAVWLEEQSTGSWTFTRLALPPEEIQSDDH